jgi:hypothetical protein
MPPAVVPWHAEAFMRPAIPQALFLIALLVLNLAGLPVWGQDPATLEILIVEGQGAINNVKQRVNREPIVQVEDENHKPVAGAAVIFFLPNDGPGGVFGNGGTTLTTTTNAQGQAVARGIRLNRQAGSMQIRVAASFAGRTASTVITQTNVVGGAVAGAAAGGISLAAKLLIIGALVGGGIAAGVVISNRGGSTTNPSTVTITPGSITIGGQ